MKPINRLCVSFVAIFALSSAVNAATVSRVLKKKKSVQIKDATADEGFVKGGQACVSATEGGDTITCGKVMRVKIPSVVVRFTDAKAFKKIKKGNFVTPDGSGPTSAKTKGSKGGAKTDNPTRIWLSFAPGLNPATYNKIYYDTLTNTDSGANSLTQGTPNTSDETLWKSDAKAQFSLVGIAAGFGFPIGTRAITSGFRYRIYDEAPIDSNYDTTVEDVFARTERKATALGLWADFQYLRIVPSNSMNFDLSAGLDLDMSSVAVTTTRIDENKRGDATPLPDLVLADAKSSATTIGLRLGAGFDFRFVSSFGLHLGTHVIIPLVSSPSFSATINDPNGGRLLDTTGKDAKKDMQDALGHTKGSFAVDILLGTIIAF